MKKLAVFAAALVASTDAALANCGVGVVCVPEISALEGTAAVAALAAVVLLAWERRRRSV
jgi:hypothetical protein